MIDCLFCKIIAKEIPSDIIYENDKVISFLDINPLTKGHCLVVPKEHAETIVQASEQSLSEVIKAVKLVARKVLKAVEKDAFNLVLNNGKKAGQLIDHLHFHIIPREQGDEAIQWNSKIKMNSTELKELAEKIKRI